MKLSRFLIFFLLLALAAESLGQASRTSFPQRKRRRSPIESKVFLANWWDYYNRATRRIDSGNLKGAEQDLREAIKFRSEGSPNARTYGVRFQEYYPHYELGIILFDSGRYDEALSELKTSLKTTPLEETYFFIHEARRRIALRDGMDRSPPVLDILEPIAGTITSKTSIHVKGVARDDIYVDAITVGNRPLLVDRAKPEVRFEMEVPLPQKSNQIRVVVTDLVGRTTTTDFVVEVDREGPVFSLRNIRLSTDGKTARLKGTAYDPHQLARVAVNGIPLPIDPNQTTLEIDQAFRLSDPNGSLNLELVDGFENNTLATLDPKLEVGSADSLPRKIQLAALQFRPEYLVSAQNARQTTPEIELDGYESGQNVYLDEVYIDGWVTDSTEIVMVTCNNDSLPIPAGDHLYFGYRWGPLKAATNTLIIAATNCFGQEDTQSLTVYCKSPSKDYPNQRLRLAIDRIGRVGGVSSTPIEESFTDALRTHLWKRERFPILDRTGDLAPTFRERELRASSTTDPRFSPPIQTNQPADILLEANFLEYDGISVVDVVLQSVQSEELVNIKTFGILNTSDKAIRDLAGNIALWLEQQYPLVEGNIISTDHQVCSSLAGSDGIRRQMQVIAFRKGEEQTWGNKNRSRGPIAYPIGPMTILSVLRDYSQLRSEENMIEEPQVGDIVVTR